jgi:hypothetical protein
VARFSSPYREAVTLVVLEGMTMREAAEAMAISVSGMKSRVQRGRAQLRELLEACCAIAVDARGKVTDVVPRERELCCTPATLAKPQKYWRGSLNAFPCHGWSSRAYRSGGRRATGEPISRHDA